MHFVQQLCIMMLHQCNITTGFPETCFYFDTTLLARIVKTVNVYPVVCWNAKSGRNAIPLVNIRISPSVGLLKRNLKHYYNQLYSSNKFDRNIKIREFSSCCFNPTMYRKSVSETSVSDSAK